MELTLKLKEIQAAEPTLAVLMRTSLRFQTALAVAKIVKAVETDLKVFGEEKQKLFEKYGEKKENGVIEVTDPEKKKGFFEEMTAAIDTDVTINFQPIPYSLMADVKLSALEIAALEPFLVDDGEQAAS
jgi:hypothetical protein